MRREIDQVSDDSRRSCWHSRAQLPCFEVSALTAPLLPSLLLSSSSLASREDCGKASCSFRVLAVYSEATGEDDRSVGDILRRRLHTETRWNCCAIKDDHHDDTASVMYFYAIELHFHRLLCRKQTPHRDIPSLR